MAVATRPVPKQAQQTEPLPRMITESLLLTVMVLRTGRVMVRQQVTKVL